MNETTQLAYVQQSGDTLASSDGGDEYTGLDRFGRIIDQYWLDYGTGSALDRFQYAYDRDGNVLYENNLLDSGYSQLYHTNSSTTGDDNTAYDNLNRLIDFQMGTLSSSGNNGSTLDKITSPSQTQSFSLDAVGNWTDFNDSATSDQTAAFNARNQYTSLSGGTATATPTYDYDGNMVTDQAGLHYKYDAWDQLVVLKASNNTTVLLTLAENALGQIFNYNDGVNAGQWNYDGNQVISYLTNAWSQMVWGLGYTNDLILRDRDADNNLSTGTYGYGTGQEERIYAQQDANYNVTSLYNLTTSGITERLVYDPYGKSTTLTAAWGAQTDTTILWKYRFQGTDFEATGGFNVMGARLQSVALGRWLQEDPSGYSDGTNLYRALRDGPTSRLDPTGLNPNEYVMSNLAPSMSDMVDGVSFDIDIKGLEPGTAYAGVWDFKEWYKTGPGQNGWRQREDIVIDYLGTWHKGTPSALFKSKYTGFEVTMPVDTHSPDTIHLPNESDIYDVVDGNWNLYKLESVPTGLQGPYDNYLKTLIFSDNSSIRQFGHHYAQDGTAIGYADSTQSQPLAQHGFDYYYYGGNALVDGLTREGIQFRGGLSQGGGYDCWYTGGKLDDVDLWSCFLSNQNF